MKIFLRLAVIPLVTSVLFTTRSRYSFSCSQKLPFKIPRALSLYIRRWFYESPWLLAGRRQLSSGGLQTKRNTKLLLYWCKTHWLSGYFLSPTRKPSKCSFTVELFNATRVALLELIYFQGASLASLSYVHDRTNVILTLNIYSSQSYLNARFRQHTEARIPFALGSGNW